MGRLGLTLACGLFDRTMPLMDGSVVPEGIDLNVLPMSHYEIFPRQARFAEFDVAEFSLATYSLLHGRGDRRMIAIPVFPSRMFRHSYLYVNVAAGIRQPRDLEGRRVGTIGYQPTAAVWMRGILEHDLGVRLDTIDWYFGGVNEPEEYKERIPLTLPSSVRAHVIPSTRSLDEMLDAGDIDAFLGASPPRSFLRGSPNVARLFPDVRQVELDYYRRTGIFPIMHTVVVKREIYERAPWVAVSLYKAFERAKQVAMRRLSQDNAVHVSLPWLLLDLEDTRALMGQDPFAYGLDARNRLILDTFEGYCQEQGLTERRLTVDELFAPETLVPPHLETE